MTAIYAVVYAMLKNIQTNGYNSLMNGLYINWITGSQPFRANLDGSGNSDLNQHDILCDVRYLKSLLYFRSVYGSKEFDDEIIKWNQILKNEISTTDQRGWLYFVYADIYNFTGDIFWKNACNALVTRYASNHPTGRADWDIEEACALIKSGNVAYAQLGEQRLVNAYNTYFNPTYNILVSQGYVKPGEIGQEIEALAYANHDDKGEVLLQSTNTMLYDNVYEGYFAQADLRSGTPIVQTSKKDPGRQAEMLKAAILLRDDDWAHKLYSVVLNHCYYTAGQGVLYEVNADWSLHHVAGPNSKTQNENWVTTEAMGITIDALLEYEYTYGAV